MIKNLFYGVALIAIGAGISYYFIYMPYEAMRSHAGSIEVTDKAVALGPFILVMGIGFLLATILSKLTGGDTTKPLTQQGRVASWTSWLFVALAIAAGGYTAFSWMPDQQLKYGYIRGE